MRTLITGGTLLTPHQTLPQHTLIVEGTKISGIEPPGIRPDPDDTVIDAQGMWVTPGLIDVHVHGSVGYDTMDATAEALHTMARFFARHGVTGYLPTTGAAPAADTWAAIENVMQCPQPQDGGEAPAQRDHHDADEDGVITISHGNRHQHRDALQGGIIG